MAKCKDKIKRTKTFTGCLTCRSRSVKCGEERPACLRCRNALLKCEGYKVVLTWPGYKESGPQRMSILDSCSELYLKTISTDALSSTITALDTVPYGTCYNVGLFGVFPTKTDPQAQSSSFVPEQFNSSDNLDEESDNKESEGADYDELVPASGGPIPLQLVRCESHDDGSNGTLARYIVPIPRKDEYYLEPSLYNSLPMSSRDERQLMHYWITHLSTLLMPVRSRQNPFQIVMVPLALAAMERNKDAAGSSSLLNSLYAFAAVSQGNLGHTKHYGILSAKYLQLCFQQLRLSLSETNADSPKAILSAIIVLLMIGIFNRDATNWRVHLNGALIWLRSVERSTWEQDCNASTIYDIFMCMEALRPAPRTLALDLKPCNLFLEDTMGRRKVCPERDWSLMPQGRRYYLDSVFGIKQPFLEIIIQINSWIYNGYHPTTTEVQDLELKIVFNDPDRMKLPCSTIEEHMIQLHARLFHASTYLYFSRLIQNLPLCGVQHLVRRGIENLDAIALLEQGLNVSGLLWPAFITGCEANDSESRGRIDAYFDRRETFGIGNVKDARRVVREVWRRRDMMDVLVDISWHEVMLDLGLDILLS